MLDKKVLNAIQRYDMFSPGDVVIVGVSDGPDSMALLHILSKLQNKIKISLHVVHLNHKIRGKEARSDMEFVETFSKAHKIPVTCKEIDVKAFAKKEKLSLEDAARRVRYKFYDEVVRKVKASKIALGHTATDNVETVLMRLATGTGTRGLLGIPAKRGKIVRPLIDCGRDEIEEYCKKHKLKPRVDKTNFETKYLRNKIRHKLIPVLESINPNVKNAIKQAIELLHSDYDYLMDMSIKALHGATIKKVSGSIKLDIDKLLMYPDSIRRYVLRAAIEDVKGDLENITFTHIEDILSKLPDDEKWELHLPNGIFIYGDGDVLEVSTSRPEEGKRIHFEYKLKVGDEIVIKEAGSKIKAEAVAIPKKLKIKDKNQALLDLGKTGYGLVVRSRKMGDRFYPFGISGSKKLKDFLIDEKIPAEEKDLVPIVEAKGKIVWIGGHRIDNRFRITKSTKKALKMTFQRA